MKDSSTPDQKLSTQFSSGKEDRRGSDQLMYNGTDQSKTFISTSEHQVQMSIMEDRVSKLESLVWALYKELNGKIESTSQSTQMQFEDLANQMGLSQKLKRSEDGYEGSEEEHPHQITEAEGEEGYIQSSLYKVEEEMSSQYYSQEGGDEFSRNTVDKSDPNVALNQEKTPYDYQPTLVNIEEESKEASYQHQPSYDNTSPEFYGNRDVMSKQTDTPEHSEGEGENDDELEYYFSCHERMVHDYEIGK